MSEERRIDVISIVIVLFALLLTVLFMHGEEFGIRKIVDEDAETNTGSVRFTENDQNGDWDDIHVPRIILEGTKASASGGAYALDGNVHITAAGRYVVSGTLDNGSIIIETQKTDKVWLLLNGAEISCYDGAALRVEQADKVFLTLAEGTENSIASEFSAAAEEAGIDGALFSRDDLTINGNGSLTVVSATRHGIVCNDDLVITGGKIRVEAAQDAIHANDSIRITGAELSLNAYDDGISLTGAEGELYIESGRAEIRCSDNGLNSANRICITGGTFDIDAGNDGITAAGAIEISGGTLNIRAYDDAIHSDLSVLISGGVIEIPDCNEGVEAVQIDITGGAIHIVPLDDGMNATRGESMETWLHISGGSITIVNPNGIGTDGLDSNGDIEITGGTIVIDLGTSEKNHPFDCIGEMTVTGGEIITD